VTEYLGLEDALLTATRLGFHARDIGLLDSALARPSSSMFGQAAYPDLPTKAAALLESLARNHPFFDGNKRSAWLLTVQFLWINGFRHDFDTDAAFDLVMGVAQGSIELAESAATISAHLVAHP